MGFEDESLRLNADGSRTEQSRSVNENANGRSLAIDGNVWERSLVVFPIFSRQVLKSRFSQVFGLVFHDF